MRQLHLNLAAIALLALSAFLILRQSLQNSPAHEIPKVSTNSTPSTQPSSQSTQAESISRPAAEGGTVGAVPLPRISQAHGKPQAKETSAGEAAAHFPDRSVTNRATTSLPTTPEPSSANPAPGIQLADDVQLPAVIIALSDPNKDPQHKIPPPVAAAMQRIVDSFYQELAASVRENPMGEDTKPTEADGLETVVIQPGPAVEQARANANEAYRVLFGDEAFNRLMMNAALEARLPKNPGQK